MIINKEQLIAEICNGNKEAFEFITLWLKHCHLVDDIIDEGVNNQQELIEAFTDASAMFNHPFYQRNYQKLYSVYILSAVAYNTSLGFKEQNYQNLADVLRSFGNQMLIIIAGICSTDDETTFKRMCNISFKVHKLSWQTHHDETGKPI